MTVLVAGATLLTEAVARARSTLAIARDVSV
jgi:hypothetical protein